MADNSRAINRVFTRKVISDLVQDGKSDVFDYVVKRYVEDPSGKTHGQLISEIYTRLNQQQRSVLTTYQSTAFPGILINSDAQLALERLSEINFNKESLLTVMDDQDKQQLYEAMGLKDARYTLCPFDRYVMQMSIKNRVLFEDRFRKRSRNADYPKDEFFSRDHLDFSEIAFAGSNFVGFGDYSIIGKEYNESGFAPYAVAIHIVYFENDNSLRIRHFVSDSNDDITDVAGKFYEAVSKLYEWYITENQERQLTMGLNTLLEHYKNKTYPGLPTLKKLSVMHHLELVGRYLDGDLK